MLRSRGARDRRRRAWPAACAALLVLAAGCSLIVNRGTTQCARDADCAKFPGTVCQQGGCVGGAVNEGGPADVVAEPAPAVTTCTSTQDCLPDHGGANWICRKSDSTCVSVLSQDCPGPILGNYTSDDTVLVGAIVPLAGPYVNIGAALQDTVRLAVNDFSAGLPPARPGGNARPLAVVLCDESDDVQRATRHLRQDLRVPVILGTAFDASTLSVAQELGDEQDGSTGAGPLIVSPGACSDLSAARALGPVWRTIPSDQYQAAAIDALVTSLEPGLAAAHGVTSLRVAIVRQADGYGTFLDDQVTTSLVFNGAAATAASNAAFFTQVDYGDPDQPSADPNPDVAYASAINSVTHDAATVPDLIILMGYSLAVTKVLAGIESAWPSAASYRPQYILSNGMESNDLLAEIGDNDALRTRILGTAPGTNPGVDPGMSQFVSLYGLTFSDATSPLSYVAANTYDAIYTAAFGIAATHGSNISGADVLTGLQRIFSPDAGATSVDVGPAGISGALSAIQAGQGITPRGVSGPLSFDLATGDVVSDIQVWCVARGSAGGNDGGAGLALQVSGASYTSTSAAPALVGTISPSCTH